MPNVGSMSVMSLTDSLVGVMLSLKGHDIVVLLWTLVLGTPTLSLISALGVAITIGLPRGGFLLALLVVPLYVPVLLLGANSAAQAMAGLPIAGPLALMAALFFVSLACLPFLTAMALRVSLST